jgi:hypothetical protein
VILTSRPDEYRAAIEESGVVPTASAAIELLPLQVEDLANYLPFTRAGRKWRPIIGRLQNQRTDPAAATLGEALSTPLMASLAGTAYRDTADDPRKLFDRTRFRSARPIEDHLLDQFIETTYGAPTDDFGSTRRWAAEDARRWLAFLARHLHAQGTDDLQWWQLSPTGSRLATLMGVGLALSLAVALARWLGFAQRFLNLPIAIWYVFGVFCLIAFAGIALAPYQPRLALRRIRVRGRLRGYLGRVGIGVLITVPLWFVSPIPAALLVLAAGLTAFIDVQADIAAAASPRELLHGCGDDVVGERFAPAAEGQVRGDHDRALLVARGDELKEQVRRVLVERDVADLVDDDQLVATDLLQLRLPAQRLPERADRRGLRNPRQIGDLGR